jgi:Acetyltransferase (GNAT) domain
MSGEANIQYLTNSQIDKDKWDKCIDNASNGLIYGYSFYLDALSKNWDALVVYKGLHSNNEYEMVMPLTWNKKYGFKYLCQPFLIAQLGIFGNTITKEQVANFIAHIPSSFRLIEISLNKNNIEGLPAGSYKRNNYILDLSKPYEILYSNYRENIQRNIKKSVQSGSTIQKGFDVEKVIELAIKQMKEQGNKAGENADRFRKLYHFLHAKQMATTYGIMSAQNELLASCVFFFSHNRAYYILVGNHPAGKNTGASPALIDTFIKDHAGKNLLLDFEGSDIPTLAHFYSSFGAVKINRLPFYLKWLKK